MVMKLYSEGFVLNTLFNSHISDIFAFSDIFFDNLYPVSVSFTLLKYRKRFGDVGTATLLFLRGMCIVYIFFGLLSHTAYVTVSVVHSHFDSRIVVIKFGPCASTAMSYFNI